MTKSKSKVSKYQKGQRAHQIDLIQSSNLFQGTKAGAKYRGKNRDFILLKGENNLYNGIRPDAINYFKNNKIGWWGGKNVSGHILSSQVACVNHLFPIRENPEILIHIINNVTGMDFEEVLPIPDWLDITEGKKHYIAFEAVSYKDHLNEIKEEGVLTRGSNCTSIDALMIAKDKNQDVWIIPIEWKYTEFYENQDKSKEDRTNEPKGANGKGKERLFRYSDLISQSKRLKTLDKYEGSIYFQEPFYQLMRQTLWSEQIIAKESEKWYNATKFLHLHIVPSANRDLLDRNYRRFDFMKSGMEATWKQFLKNKELYKVIDPKTFMQSCHDSSLIDYLQKRYWE